MATICHGLAHGIGEVQLQFTHKYLGAVALSVDWVCAGWGLQCVLIFVDILVMDDALRTALHVDNGGHDKEHPMEA